MFAAQDIAQGEFIREYVGRIIDGAAYKEIMAFGRGLYIMALEGDFYVDAMHWGNESRLFNHSHSPNSRAELWWVRGEPRVGIYAARKIKSGAQIIFNYGSDCFIAACSSARCNRKRAEKNNQ
jgi:histone-lysine N-methyltransferase SETD2